MALNSPLLLPAILLGVILLARLLRARRFDVLVHAASHAAWVPVAVGCGAVLLTAWIWGGLRAPAVVHDEAAYLLQGALFARGRWTLPSPGEFAAFTQPAVLVTPVLAPKMPVGHALLLAPGIAIGLPGLVPVLLVGAAAALIFAIARRIWGTGIATLTVVLWLTQAGQSRWRASYFSENTTAAAWLAGWWCLLRWRDHRRSGWLIALAVVTGWGAITRPLTMLAFAVPVGAVVLHDLIRLRQWRPLAVAATAGTLVLMLLPIQNVAVLGSWRRSPLTLYTRQYLPFDRMGFGVDSTAPELALPPDIQAAMQGFVARHREHQPAALPRILGDRLGHAGTVAFTGWRKSLLVAGLLGLLLLGASGWFAVASLLALYLAHLLYAHEAHWTLYYYEATPVLALVVALGLDRLLRIAVGPGNSSRWVSIAAAAGILLLASDDFGYSRRFRAADQLPFRRLELAANDAGSHLLVFIRYGPEHDSHVSLVRNVADPARARLITAYDRGAGANRRVAALFPDRTPYIWDEVSHQLLRGS